MSKSNSTWNEIFDLQKKIYLSNKKKIKELEPQKSTSLLHYEKKYLKAVQSYQAVSSYDDIINSIKKSDIILVGDYHTLNQSQRSLLRLMRSLTEKKIKYNLCLELFRVKHQNKINQFLKGKIDILTLKQRINFTKDWYFDFWDHFIPILDFSYHHQIPVFGIEANQKDHMTIQKRDELFAHEIIKILQNKNPEKLMIHVGDLHLAKDHLPHELLKLNSQLKILTLYQNSESIYWNLAEQGIASNTVAVKISENEFCRMHTPPIMVQQSYLHWLEQEGESIDYDQANLVFHDYLEKLARFFNIQIGKQAEKIEVFTCEDLSLLSKIKDSKQYSIQDFQEMTRQISISKSYYIKKFHFVYLADLSMNHIAEQAMNALRHLHHFDENPRSEKIAFYLAIINQTLGYLGSKVINHHRKCMRPFQVEKKLKNLSKKTKLNQAEEDELEIYGYFMSFQRLLKKSKLLSEDKIGKLTTDQYRTLVKIIGNYCGERVFYAMLDKYISKDELRTFITNRFEDHDPMELIENYIELIQKTYKTRIPRRV